MRAVRTEQFHIGAFVERGIMQPATDLAEELSRFAIVTVKIV